MGVAFAGNLFTLFLCYELLTLSTYPLVTHKATPEAMRAGRVYLGLLTGTSMVLLLPAIITTGVIAGTLDFLPGGILSGKTSALGLGLLPRQRHPHRRRQHKVFAEDASTPIGQPLLLHPASKRSTAARTRSTPATRYGWPIGRRAMISHGSRTGVGRGGE